MPATEQPVNLEELLDGAEFPVERGQLVSLAQDNGGSQEAIELIRGLPDRKYVSMQDLNKGLGTIEKIPGQHNMFPSMDKKATQR